MQSLFCNQQIYLVNNLAVNVLPRYGNESARLSQNRVPEHEKEPPTPTVNTNEYIPCHKP